MRITLSWAALWFLLATVVQGVGPPPAAMAPVRLSSAQEARLGKVVAEQHKAALAGEMGRALRLAEEEASLRRQWQGRKHWQAIDTRFEMEVWSRLARLPRSVQQEAARALKQQHLGIRLQAHADYVAAEQAFRDALALRKKALGEDHPDTATSYVYVALCLHLQRQAAQALPLFEKALAISKKALGDDHPATASCYYNVATCLKAQGQTARALPLHKKALAIRQKVLGEDHPQTAFSANNLASCLEAQGKAAQALPLYEQALAIHRKALGEERPETANSYNNVAACLQAQGRMMQALPLMSKALAIYEKVLGEEHPSTANSYNNLAFAHFAQGQVAQALPLLEKALAIWKKVLGEEHPSTADSYNNLAACLQEQGRIAQALALSQKALAIYRKVLGDDHPRTADGYNNLGYCLVAQGKQAQALRLFENTLAIHKKALGEDHPTTARSYNNVACCLDALGKPTEALPFHQKALALRKKLLGEDHLETEQSYTNLAFCLKAQGQAAEALPLYQKGLAICRKVLGDDHPRTADGYNNLALCLAALGKPQQAIPQWERALLGVDAGRLARAKQGFNRARFGADRFTPRQGLALAHARLKEAEKAWAYAEADLARNLLDDLAGAAPAEWAAFASLRQLDERLVPLFGRAKRTNVQEALREELARQRKAVLARLARNAADRSAGQVAPLAEVQKHLPAHAALLLWVGGKQENWGCVVRAQGPPRWVQLTGTGARGAWTVTDAQQPLRLLDALADPRSSSIARRELTRAVRDQWFAPLEQHFKAEGKLPAVTQLFVIAPWHFAALPVEVLAHGHTVSYTPSATALVRTLRAPRALTTTPALALGDPVFQPPALPAPPKHGLLIALVPPNGPSHKAGLRAGDVLVRYDGQEVRDLAGLVTLFKKNRDGKAILWRDGKEVALAGPLPLDFRYDRRPVAEALRAYRDGTRGAIAAERFAPLPGTRAEVRALQRLLGKGCTALLGSDASERQLEALQGRLTKYRILHFATHGEVNLASPERSRVILARDQLPSLGDNANRAAQGQRPYTGELTVEDILGWQLDADLVVLSACQSGLGAASSGDGLLGFSYALMRAGARSVVLSRWKVDDTATALLMVRFYENLLGKAKGLTKSMGRAEALAEAKKWLRELSRKDAEKLAIALSANKLSGTRGSIVELNVKVKPKLPAGDRPYEHPFFWAAFVLVGDPD